MKTKKHVICGGLAVVCGAVVAGSVLFAAPPEAPKASTYAPLEDLGKYAESLLKSIEESLADEKAFAEGAENVKRDTNTLIALSLVMAKHDTVDLNSPETAQKSAKAIKPLQALAAAKDYAAAKAAWDEFKQAVEAPGDVAIPEWGKVAGMGQCMKQVGIINTRLRRNLRRVERTADSLAQDSVALAALAQNFMYDTHEVKNPADTDKWYAFCAEMRAAAAELNAAAHAKDTKAATTAAARLQKNCDDCHAVFRPEELKK